MLGEQAQHIGQEIPQSLLIRLIEKASDICNSLFLREYLIEACCGSRFDCWRRKLGERPKFGHMSLGHAVVAMILTRFKELPRRNPSAVSNAAGENGHVS